MYLYLYLIRLLHKAVNSFYFSFSHTKMDYIKLVSSLTSNILLCIGDFYSSLVEQPFFPWLSSKAMVLNLGCSREPPGELLKSLWPGLPWDQSNHNLKGRDSDMSILKAPQVLSVGRQGWEPLFQGTWYGDAGLSLKKKKNA